MQHIEEHDWSSIGDRVRDASPRFAKIIDHLSPSKDYKLYLLKYPYGDLILDHGNFHVVNKEGRLVLLSDPSVDKHVQDDLSYTGTMPVGMILHNSIETFFSVRFIDRERAEIDRTVPSSFYASGDMISLWRILEGDQTYQEGSLWNITSGSRTLCMLPKITNRTGIDTLVRKFGPNINKPKYLTEHWGIFKSIAQHPEFSQPWHSEVLCFSKKWFEHSEDEEWSSFYAFMQTKAWNDSNFKRNQFIFDFAFSLAQNQANLKPNPYVADTVKHLIGIGTGSAPGFKPALDNVPAPIEGLQKVFVEDYGLREYLPVIMYTDGFSSLKPSLIYYSLEMPTTTEFSPVSNRANSKMKDMRELKTILEKFLNQIIDKRLMVEKTPMFKLANEVEYKFYHSNVDQYREILHSPMVIEEDKTLLQTLYKCEGYEFPAHSSFFNGCITIKLPHKA